MYKSTGINTARVTALCAALLLACGSVSAAVTDHAPQASRVSQAMDAYRGKGEALVPIKLFNEKSLAPLRADTKAANAVTAASFVELDGAAVSALLNKRPNSITLSLPTQQRGTIELELFQADVFATNFSVTLSSGAKTDKLERGLHYRGVIKGEGGSIAAVSVFDNQIMGTFSTPTDGNWTIGRYDAQSGGSRHIIYPQSAMTNAARRETQQMCGNDARDVRLDSQPRSRGDVEGAAAASADGRGTLALTTKCATQWLEAEHDIVQTLGSAQEALNYMTGLFNNSATLYANDGIALRLERIYIWDTPDPYSGTSSDQQLGDFGATRALSFTGTVAQLITFRNVGGGGVAAGFAGICNGSRIDSMAVSEVRPMYSAVPVFSNAVQIVTHEVGHLLGSRHTHACVWNGTNTAIDSCAQRVEGTCALPGLPAGGGTIMSYCEFTPVGTNFNNGFGPEPSALIRGNVEAGGCLADCNFGENGGGALAPGQVRASQAAATSTGLLYRVEVPATATNLTFTTSGGTGDADMFIRAGSAPTTSSPFACRSIGNDNTESCVIANPTPGFYYMLLYAAAGYANVNVGVSYGDRLSYGNNTTISVNDLTTVESSVTVSGRSGNAPANALLTVAIRDDDSRDLTVELVAPDGTAYLVHDRTARPYRFNRTVQLNLSSEALNGTWKLRLKDLRGNDAATDTECVLDGWTLTL